MRLKKRDNEPRLKDNKLLYTIIAVIAMLVGSFLYDFIATLF